MDDPDCSLEVRWVQGLNKRNVTFMNDSTVCYPCGNFIVFIDAETRKQSLFQCTTGSIGAFAVNITSEVVAFSDQKLKPDIYVYTYPGFVKRAQLKGGAELDYSLIAFSYSGSFLASYSSVPDHTLTIWNWYEGIPLCSRSESSTIFTSLTFNPFNTFQLCLSNETSICVWNIEVCDTVYQLQALPVRLPNEEGTIPVEEEERFHTTSNLSYYGPLMPISSIAGLVDDSAGTFIPKEQRKPVVSPSSHCWSSASDIYVGCKGGHLLAINSETQTVTVLSQKQQSEDSFRIALREGSITMMALHRDGLYIAGSDGILRRCSIKGTEFKVENCWDAKEPIESISVSANYKMLSVATSKGSLYLYNTHRPEDTLKMLSGYSEDWLAADFVTTGNTYCLTLGMAGDMQVWSVEDGRSIGGLNLNIQATCMACCPSSHYAAVGSNTGHVYFIDLNNIETPRIIQRTRLYHLSVKHLHFDQQGKFLLTGAADGYIFILDARPSCSFQVLGCTVAGGDILSLSTLSYVDSQQVKTLALVCPTGQNNEEEGGTRLVLFSLPSDILISSRSDDRGMFKDSVILKCLYEVEQPLVSAVLGSNAKSVFGYSSYSPFIYKFLIPEETSAGPVVFLNVERKVRGSRLGPGSLILSPHHKWLAVSAKDGILYLQDSYNLEGFAQPCCHSYHTGGIRSMAFSLDGHSIVTTGIGDGTLVYLRWKSNIDKMKASFDYGYLLKRFLSNSMASADEALTRMSLWSFQPDNSTGQREELEDKPMNVEVTTQDDSYTNPSLAADPTWLDQKMIKAVNEETQKYASEKKKLKDGVKELRQTIQAMMRENESLPDIEKLDQQEFNLDTEEQERLLAESEQEVARVRKEIELENLSKQYLREIIKQECWDSMAVKGRSIVAFHTEYEVNNYPLKERSTSELEDFARVLNTKKIEAVDLKARKEIVEFQTKLGPDEEDEVEEESVQNEESTSLIGSLSDQYGGDTSNLYSQLALHTREEKINQIILLQDIIHNVKKAFNKEFDLIGKQKEQEVTRVKERNQRILEIMSELSVQEKTLDPEFTDNEKPERALTVEDNEVKVQKYLTPEQKAKTEQLQKQEEERRLAAQGDNAKERALNDMMGGVLEVKKEDILRMAVPEPAFLSRSEAEWNEDERKQLKEYEKKCKELNEEKEKYRKVLEAEMKKLQSSIQETTQSFDDMLTKLFEKKVKSEMVIYQEELKISNLIFSILIEEEMNTRLTQLNHILEKKRKEKSETSEAMKTFKAQVDEFREAYDNLVAEDKLLDRGFKKEFSDIPAHQVDQLYKLYKRRPRVQRLRTQTDNASPFGDRPGSAKAYNESIVQLMRAMDEFDALEHMPDGLELSVWQRFCLSRRSKMEYEQQVKRKALILAEMQSFLQRRVAEDEKTRQDMENIMQELNVLRNEKMKFQLDLTVQFLLKQGQVEVENKDLIPDFEDALLLHRSVVEDLNSTIRGLGEQKIASMVESKDFRKGIVQLEWEHKKIRMEMEDLKQKSRDITMLRVSKELQIFLNESDYSKRVSDQLSVLEETLNVQEKHHEKNVKSYKRIVKDIEKDINKKMQANVQLDKDLHDLLLSFSERKHIYEVVGAEKSSEKHSAERYKDLIRRRKLVDLANTQAHEISVLRAEVDRLRMKTFPALIQMEY
ncbi:cilia- and flagella-associated protein 43 [Spea bombifrons]|uniref:cilia- and flagella-associated protein 43 n=1 Tax=Spea bombifrons TaxID=233779 RepID=UPI00234A0667|nr:cilia- and flagella-associated protein 43 [Spea bombifrons]